MTIFKYLKISNWYYYYKQWKIEKKYSGKNISVGLKTQISNSALDYNVHISNDCYINNCTIGSNTYINDNSSINYVNIGKFCSIASKVQINLGKHPVDLISTHPAFFSKNKKFKCYADKEYFLDEINTINIGNDVWIGHGAIIMGGVEIGNGAVIAAGSVVTKDVRPYAIVGGVPAKLIKYRFSENQIDTLNNVKWWDFPEEWLKINFKLFLSPVGFFKHFNENKY